MAEQKTNVMRILEQKKVPYTAHSYAHEDGAVDGATVAKRIGKQPEQVFKTLVTVGASKNHYVIVVPVQKELDLKKAAKAVGEKSIAMIHQKELLPLTGYVHGGCSPVGMKKQFRTTIDISCETQETMLVSAGKIGQQIEVKPSDLLNLVRGTTADIVTEA